MVELVQQKSMTNLDFGKEYVLNKNTITRVGYDFDGWNTEIDGSGYSYPNLGKIKSLATLDNENVVLYAQWIPTTNPNCAQFLKLQ